MKKPVRFFLLLLCLVNFSSGAEWEMPPKTSTLKQQIELLLAIRAEIPSLVENGTEYDVDIFRVFQMVNQFTPVLQKAPGFSAQAREREYFHTIRASYVRSQVMNSFVLTPDAIVGIRAAAGSKRLKASELSSYIDKWLEYDIRSILTGLASIQPDEAKKTVFRSPSIKDKLYTLTKNPIDDKTLKAKFRFSETNIPEAYHNYKDLMRILHAGYEAEDVIWKEVMASFARDRSVKLESVTSDDVVSRLLELSDGNPQVVDREMQVHAGLESRYFRKEKKEVEVVEESITLREVPGSLALFRGIVGSDCSTSSSCPVALLPAEHTFFIYDSNGILRGYLSGTNMNVDYHGHVKDEDIEHPAFYLHDFAGPRLSARTAKLAIAALAHEIEKLGMKEIVVPVSERMILNMNYKVISDAIETLVDDEGEVTNLYLDNEIRTYMMHHDPTGMTDWSYDSQEANETSRPIDLKELRMKDLRVETVRQRAAEIEVSAIKLTQEEATLLMLDLMSPEAMKSSRQAAKDAVAEVKAAGYETNQVTYVFRTQAAQQIGGEYGVDAAEVQKVLKVLQNPKGLTLAKYYEAAKVALNGIGVQLTDKIVEEHPHFFFEGQLAAPDRLNPSDAKMKARTIEYTIGVLRRWPDSESAWEGILANPVPFQESGRFQSYIRSLLVGPEPQLGALEELLSVGFDFSFLNTEKDIESLELRRSNAKSAKIKTAIKKVMTKFCEGRVGKAG